MNIYDLVVITKPRSSHEFARKATQHNTESTVQTSKQEDLPQSENRHISLEKAVHAGTSMVQIIWKIFFYR